MPLQDFSTTGLLGGWVAGEETTREKERFEIEKQEKQLELRQKAAEVSDYEYETGARRAEVDVREQTATRIKKLGPQLDEAARLKVDNEIITSETTNDLQRLNTVYNIVQSARDQESYDLVMDHTTPAQRKQWGLTGDYKKDQNTLQYIGDRAQHSLQQLQEMELIGLKGRYAVQEAAAGNTSNVFTPSGAGRPISDEGRGSTVLDLTKDPDFRDLYTNQIFGVAGDPAQSQELLVVGNMVAQEAASITDTNEQDRRNDKSGKTAFITWDDAQREAQLRVKSFLYNGIGSHPLRGAYLKMLSPEKAAKQYEYWKAERVGMAMRDPKFAALPSIKQERLLYLAYIQEKKADLLMGKQQLAGVINSRSE